MDRQEFEVKQHPGLKTELWLTPGLAWGLLWFLTNDADFFELVRAITRCDRIGSFKGRVYQMLPGPQHADSWHDDLKEGRMLAMSINLGGEAYAGGLLEIRDRASKRTLHRARNTGPGDALIFRLDPTLQHRVTAVEGNVAKTAYAGWFMPGPDSELLRPTTALSGGRE